MTETIAEMAGMAETTQPKDKLALKDFLALGIKAAVVLEDGKDGIALVGGMK